ncbi:MAG: response regulator [Bacteroidetes bacterium]|jgi:CheY-like chemotaxis protein|nr:response regulator [Bacteroidota bacterium]MBT4969777.1 response regulator [Bacteroidota bacterium]MBT6686058.1 response regulator [Bacteroidota bacterium]MBT7142722.1 response regulator [Bacteroidota bacterium]MBT7491337.1 response regulator [Bacteroidota bacterium]
MTETLINVLLVEDDKVDIMNVKRAFKKNKIENPLFVAENGVEALELLRGQNPNQKIVPLPRIILLDLNMPKMGGLEFLKILRNDENLRNISVFVMTTSNDDKDKVEAYNLNVAGYILKPLSMANFINAVSVLNNYWRLNVYP